MGDTARGGRVKDALPVVTGEGPSPDVPWVAATSPDTTKADVGEPRCKFVNELRVRIGECAKHISVVSRDRASLFIFLAEAPHRRTFRAPPPDRCPGQALPALLYGP